MFGKIGEIGNMLKQAQQMKARIQEMQEQATNMKYEADSGAGAVRAIVNGRLELTDIKVNPSTLEGGDTEMLEDLIKAAVAGAQKKAAEDMKAEMQKLTGGMNLPGLDSMLGG